MKCLANMCNECPAKLETGCRGLYSKEGLCDYPYIGNKKLLVGCLTTLPDSVIIKGDKDDICT